MYIYMYVNMIKKLWVASDPVSKNKFLKTK